MAGRALGLSISKRLIELMDGTIEVESQEGVGSTFWIRLTFACSPPDPSLLTLPTPVIPVSLPIARILLVEDNPINRQVALLQLQKLGYAVDCASTGVEALAATWRVPYDLVLMDCQLPEMDGFVAATAIRSRELTTDGRRVPIIALTGTELTAGRQRFCQAGMDDHLLKPVRLAELKQVLDRWLPGLPFSKAATVDKTAIASMRELVGDDPAALSHLMASFLADADTLLQNLWLAVASRQENDNIFRLAHTLKSSSAICGAAGMAAMCSHIESAAQNGDLRDATAWMIALETEFERFTGTLLPQ